MSTTELLDRETISQAVDALDDWAVGSLTELVSYPSILGDEAPAQTYVAGLYDSLGYQTDICPVDIDKIKNLDGFSPVDWSYTDRPNVAAVHHVKNPAGRSLVFNGHIDVVSPEPESLWTNDPFKPVIKQEGGERWMYGRGAADMKGGTVCYLWALKALQEMGLEPASKVILQSPIEEECTGNGALSLLHDGYTGEACLIPEPFNETILRNQVGVMWFQVRILGRTTHVLGAGAGVNAIEKSWPVIKALRALEEEVNQPHNIPDAYKDVDHPLNLNVGTISGGDWASTVAGECVTRFRFGVFPGQGLDDLKAKIEARVQEAAAADPWLKDFPPTVEYIGFQAEGCHFDVTGEFGHTLSHQHKNWRGSAPEILDATCTTDVRFFNLYHDIPATCYGPKGRDIHGVDECVSLDSMKRVAEVMVSLIESWCGVQKLGTG